PAVAIFIGETFHTETTVRIAHAGRAVTVQKASHALTLRWVAQAGTAVVVGEALHAPTVGVLIGTRAALACPVLTIGSATHVGGWARVKSQRGWGRRIARRAPCKRSDEEQSDDGKQARHVCYFRTASCFVHVFAPLGRQTRSIHDSPEQFPAPSQQSESFEHDRQTPSRHKWVSH
ncbi:MAG: hypothetical protein ACI9OJ_002026, partial [Myxococcota bacterium]